MKNTFVFKLDRIIHIYFKLAQGEIMGKRELSQHFQVTERSIQRDLSALRCFLAEQNMGLEIVYDKAAHGYYIQNISPTA